MNDETPINQEKRAPRRQRWLPEPIGAVLFAFQERVIWPLQDRFSQLGPGPNRTLVFSGGAVALLAVVGVVAVLALSSGGGSSAPATTVAEAAAPREPLIAAGPKRTPTKKEAPRETLHGAAPVFTPPSPASKGGVKTGKSKAAESGPSSEASTPASTTPASARISSDPKNSKTSAGATASSATAARAAVPEGPPAGPAALGVAREFAQGFVVYETGGESSGFRDAFKASAIPQLTKALLQRPPKQPAGVEVPRAKVLNVVAGPSQGSVYKVSVSLLRVGVTSELRLDMERIKTAGKSGKRAEWRVTNVLG